MIDHTAMQLAMQAKLLTLLVCTTGSTSLSATATGYARAAGSFLADGFVPGMEVSPTGFTFNTTPATITAVDALTMTVTGGRVVESASAARTLTVGLPSRRAWENVAFKKVPGQPYVEEQYIPGPESLVSAGTNGTMVVEPMYSPRVYVPAGVGIAAGGKYRDAIRKLFPPKTTLTVGSDAVRVRGDVAPFLGQRYSDVDENWSVEPITIPFRCYTLNTL